MSWFNRLFGRDGEGRGLFGKPLSLLSATPSAKRGQLRPGHLSVDAARLRALKPKDQQSAGGNRLPQLAPPKEEQRSGGNRLPQTPPKDQQRSGPTVPAGPGVMRQGPAVLATPRGAQAQRTPAAATTPRGAAQRPATPSAAPAPHQVQPGRVQMFARGRAAQQTTPAAAQRRLPGRLSGLGELGDPVPFVGNAKVWVSTQKLPLRGAEQGMAGLGTQVHWPDGTPVIGAFWLPKLDLSSSFDPRLPDTWALSGDPRYEQVPDPSDRRLRINKVAAAGAGWAQSDDARAAFGKPGWVWIKGFSATQPYGNPLLQAPIAAPFDRVYGDQLVDNNGRPGHIQMWLANFDWATYPPEQQAAIWLWLNLWDPTGVTWTVQDAEIYRADLQDVATAGEPTTLPGAAWLCLDVLDAMITGAHGMPVMVKDDGTLDKDVFTAFLTANPDWVPLLSFGKNSAGMLAIVNDLGAQGGVVVHVTPPTPPPRRSPPPPVIPAPPPGDETQPPPPPDPPPYQPPPDPPPYQPPPDPGTIPLVPGGGSYPYGGGDPYGGGRDEYGDGASDDEYFAALWDLIMYLLSLDDDAFVEAILLLDDDTFAVVVFVLGLDELAA